MSGADLHGGRLRLPRSRGALSGAALILLGAWGALLPLIGPYAHFGFGADRTWDVTAARLWFQILPGVVALVGGVLLLAGANRIVTSTGAWLAVTSGAWFVVGPVLAPLVSLGSIGVAIHSVAPRIDTHVAVLEQLLSFSALGGAILLLGGIAVGRLGVVSVRDVQAAQRREAAERYQREQTAASAMAARDRDPFAGAPPDPAAQSHTAARPHTAAQPGSLATPPH